MTGPDHTTNAATKGSPNDHLLSVFIPHKNFFITPLIIDLNILHFILMSFFGGSNILEPDPQALIDWGANYSVLTKNGQWWRLITGTFEHIGLFHLLFNMFALMYVGIYLEPLLGKRKFAIAYLFTGIVASYSSLLWHDQPVIAAGASGAIFGMYGMFVSLLTTHLIDKKSRVPLLASIVVFTCYCLLGGLNKGVDNAAHFGGLISGWLLGYVFYFFLKKDSSDLINE